MLAERFRKNGVVMRVHIENGDSRSRPGLKSKSIGFGKPLSELSGAAKTNSVPAPDLRFFIAPDWKGGDMLFRISRLPRVKIP